MKYPNICVCHQCPAIPDICHQHHQQCWCQSFQVGVKKCELVCFGVKICCCFFCVLKSLELVCFWCLLKMVLVSDKMTNIRYDGWWRVDSWWEKWYQYQPGESAYAFYFLQAHLVCTRYGRQISGWKPHNGKLSNNHPGGIQSLWCFTARLKWKKWF